LSEQGIKLYYRGDYTLKLAVDVFTTIVAVEAGKKGGGELIYDLTAVRDNDFGDNAGEGPKGLAALMDVKATYQAYNDSSTKDVALTYWFSADPQPAGWYGAYYLFGTDVSDWDGEWDDGTRDDGEAVSTYSKAYIKWEKNSAKGKDTVQNITVKHLIKPADIVTYDYYGYDYGPDDVTFEDKLPNKLPTSDAIGDLGAKAEQKKTAKQSVTWVAK